MAAVAATVTLAGLVLLQDGAEAQGDGLALGIVSYALLDMDVDGLNDTVRVAANVSSQGATGSEPFTLVVNLLLEETLVDAKTVSDTLAPDTSRTVTLLVGTFEHSTAGSHDIVVELHSGDIGGPVVGSNAKVAMLWPKGVYEIEVVANRTSATVLENDTVGFQVRVGSLSNNPSLATITAEGTQGWPLEVSTTAFELAPGGSVDVMVTLTAPPNEVPMTIERVLLTAVLARNLTASGSVLLTAQVPMQLFDVRLDIADPSARASAGGTLRFTGLVSNWGNNLDRVTLESQAQTGWTVSVEPTAVSLGRGTSANMVVLVTAPATLRGSGVVIVNVTARSQGITNFTTRELTIRYDTAELSVDRDNLTMDVSEPVAGQVVSVSATVVNGGLGDAEDLVVALLVDDEEVTRTVLPFLAAGDRVVVMLGWTSTPGFHRIVAYADVDDSIDENDEDDNWASINVDVISPDLVMTSSDITMTPEYPIVGDVANITIRVRNPRPATSGPFDVELYIDGTLAGTFRVEDGVPGGLNATVSHSWTVLGDRHTFRVEVDPGGEVLERDETNNVASRQFTGNARPMPSLVVEPMKVKQNEKVSMSGTNSTDPDGHVRQWFFDYGDGTNSGWTFNANASHVYKDKGTYTIRLYVRDGSGAESLEPASETLEVTEASDVEEPSPGPTGVVAAAALSIAAAASALAVARRRRR